jgi:malate dehydrogenase (oxaloacetate-decarboxylating)
MGFLMRTYTLEQLSDGTQRLEVPLRGTELYANPLYNKGSAFTAAERLVFGLDGALPSQTKTLNQQARRIYQLVHARSSPLEKYLELSALQDRNEQLFYKVLIDHLEEFLPVIYTPTVGQVTRRFSDIFRRGRGIWITPAHRGRVEQVIRASARVANVRLIVATDNESILGLGDQGAGGMAISIGKLALYCAAAGIHPAHTLPISLDVGTDNAALLADDAYLGWPQGRLRGAAYFALLDEFVDAVRAVFPRALVQWEDFRKDNALQVLERYRTRIASFNDDIQGTGAVAVAGLTAACRMSAQPLIEQRVLIYGAGAAGLGIARQVRSAMRADGLDGDALARAVAVLDSRGLLVAGAGPVEGYKHELSWPPHIASELDLRCGDDLLSVIRAYRPTALIGASGQARAFDEQVICALGECAQRPVVLALSNPDDLSEVLPQDALRWTQGRALVATGSPFDPVRIDSHLREIAQGNNAFIFPGLGLGALLSECVCVSDQMLAAAAQAVASAVTEQELAAGLLYPRIARLPEVSRRVAAAVIRAALAERNPAVKLADADIDALIAASTWTPAYPDYVPI